MRCVARLFLRNTGGCILEKLPVGCRSTGLSRGNVPELGPMPSLFLSLALLPRGYSTPLRYASLVLGRVILSFLLGLLRLWLFLR